VGALRASETQAGSTALSHDPHSTLARAELDAAIASLSNKAHAQSSKLLRQVRDRLCTSSQCSLHQPAVQPLQHQSTAADDITQHQQHAQASAAQLRKVLQHFSSLQQLAALTPSTCSSSDAGRTTSKQAPLLAQDTQVLRDQEKAAPVLSHQHEQGEQHQQHQQQAGGGAAGCWLPAACGPAAERQLATWLSRARVEMAGLRQKVQAQGLEAVQQLPCWGPLEAVEACAVAVAGELVLAGGAQLLEQLQQEGPQGAVHAALHVIDQVQRQVPGLAAGGAECGSAGQAAQLFALQHAAGCRFHLCRHSRRRSNT
jgi:hypothetical protein